MLSFSAVFAGNSYTNPEGYSRSVYHQSNKSAHNGCSRRVSRWLRHALNQFALVFGCPNRIAVRQSFAVGRIFRHRAGSVEKTKTKMVQSGRGLPVIIDVDVKQFDRFYDFESSARKRSCVGEGMNWICAGAFSFDPGAPSAVGNISAQLPFSRVFGVFTRR